MKFHLGLLWLTSASSWKRLCPQRQWHHLSRPRPLALHAFKAHHAGKASFALCKA